jgi:hypothetical protein
MRTPVCDSDLSLPAAVVIQPLRRQQIEEYLARGGEAFTSIRAALDASPEMWDLLEVPLMVSIVALAYRHGGDAPAGLGEEQLLAHYVDAMFRRRARELDRRSSRNCRTSAARGAGA